MGQAGRQKARRPRGRLSQRGSATLAVNLPSAAEEQSLGEEVAGSRVVARAEATQQGLRSPEKKKANSILRLPLQDRGEDRIAVRSAQVRACPNGRVLEGKENRRDNHCWWCNPETSVIVIICRPEADVRSFIWL